MNTETAEVTETRTAENTRTEKGTGTERVVGPWDWVRGAVGGFIGSMAFGLIMAFIMPPPMLEVVIPNMYGVGATPEDPAIMAGWFFHIYHGVLLGLLYVAFVEWQPIRSWWDPRKISGGIVHGIIWGVITTVALAVIAMPLWLQAVGFPEAPPFPNIGPGSIIGLIGHIIYALPVGIIYALYR